MLVAKYTLAWSCRVSFARRLNGNWGALIPTCMLLPEESWKDWVALKASWIVSLKVSTSTV